MRRTLGILALTFAIAGSLAGAAPSFGTTTDTARYGWWHVDVHTDQEFRGLAAVDATTAWVSGSAGGVWRTTDGGRSWKDVGIKEAEKAGLELRDIEASDAQHALALAIGGGRHSRIYRTSDGGKHWTRVFTNTEKGAFYDCMAMYPNGLDGLAMSDPVDGHFRVIATHDGGASWQLVDPSGMPRAKKGEFGFAASGTCLVTHGATDAYLVSGGAASRVFFSHDQGQTWTVRRSTIPASAAGGVFSIAIRGTRDLAVGGDFEKPTVGRNMSAYAGSEGQPWTNGGDLGGYRSAVDYWHGNLAFAVGPTGSDVTTDGGVSWTTFSSDDLDAVQCVHGGCWASGVEGQVVRLVRG